MRFKRLNKFKADPILKPLPMVLGLVVFLIIIYYITTIFISLYDILELKSYNLLSPLTSIFIHDLDDQGVHILSNIQSLFLIGYIASIQSSWKKMLIVFILGGFLTNLSVIFLVWLLNTTLTSRYDDWANSQGIIVHEKIQLFGLSGGGASDAIMGLLGFSLAISSSFMILLIAKIIRNILSSEFSDIPQLIWTNRYFIILNLAIIFFGTLIFLERFIADLEMFSYSLTYLYAFGGRTGIEFPQSRGNLILAHVIGTVIGYNLGLWHLVFYNDRVSQLLKLKSYTQETIRE
ncbi:MAG: hypothetical protein ACFE9L_12385 [Candidatus Hodarchaeota archaeon]